jgi:catechol 2,3-dioxygenase-like lactoylglutathione lyase family enzyme
LTILVRHTGIVVQDIEGAIDFWVILFGFSIIVDQIEAGQFIDNLLGATGISVRTVKMTDGNSVVELLRFQSPLNDESYVSPNSPFNLGLTHIALTVPNMVFLSNELKLRGYSSIGEPMISLDGKVLVAYFRTFEGLLLEIVQEIIET